MPADDIAHAIVAGFLGLELLATLDDDQQPALALFDRASTIAKLLELADAPDTRDTRGKDGQQT